MSLIEIKNYLTARHTATLDEIAAFLSVDPEIARNMLDIWIRKGKVICYQAPKCSGCHNTCKSNAMVEIFQWQG